MNIRYLRRNQSICSDIMTGQHLSILQCSICGDASVNFDPFRLLSLAIPTELDTVKIVCHVIRAHQSGKEPVVEADGLYVVKVPNSGTYRSILKSELSELCGVSKENLVLYSTYPILKEPRGMLDVTGNPQLLHTTHHKLLGKSDKIPKSVVAFETYGVGENANPAHIAKEMSSRGFPIPCNASSIGLRVEAKDFQGKWYPGTVIDISEESDTIRVHFDDFSPKWDEGYNRQNIDSRVAPIYTHSVPRKQPRQFIVGHQWLEIGGVKWVEFGQPMYLECWAEWTLAHAGAQILQEAARFVKPNAASSLSAMEQSVLFEPHLSRIAQIVESLNESAQALVDSRLQSINGNIGGMHALDADLQHKIASLLNELPFEVCLLDMLDLKVHDDKIADSKIESFPFSLLKTCGGFLHARHEIALRWKRQLNSSILLYGDPTLVEDRSYLEHMEEQRMNGKNSATLTIANCLDNLFGTKILPENERVRCAHCRKNSRDKHTMKAWRLPDILPVHIQRASFSTRLRKKLTNFVDFPLTGLDLAPWCHEKSGESNTLYDLFGVINHNGDANRGHYTCTFKATSCSWNGIKDLRACGPTGDNGEWICYDDELCTPEAPEKVVTSHAFILFYKRRRVELSNVARYSCLH